MRIEASTLFDAPAATIWSLLEDFGAIEAWWPTRGPITIERVVCEGEGVGMVRHIYNAGMDKPVSERLDFIDPDAQTLILSIVGDRPGGITAYVAIGQLTALESGQCRLDYTGFVTAGAGKEARTRENILFTWETMFAGLRERGGSQSPPA